MISEHDQVRMHLEMRIDQARRHSGPARVILLRVVAVSRARARRHAQRHGCSLGSSA